MSHPRSGVDYPNPPIEEGLCQLTFRDPLRWNVATPGLLFERLQHVYPAPPEGQEQIQASFQTPSGATDSASFAVNRGQPRYIYRDDDHQRLVVVNEQSLSVNSLRPYEGWPKLRERLATVIKTVAPVIGTPPIERIALRYVNRIVIHSLDAVDTDEYFNIKIHSMEENRALLMGLIYRIQCQLSDEKTSAQLTFTTLASESPGEHAFLLDLEFQRDVGEGLSIDDVLAVADELKVLENAEFESCIKDAARELFK